MRAAYDPVSDALYLDLSGEPSAESQEIAEGIVLDFSKSGAIVGIEIEGASKRFDVASIPGLVVHGAAHSATK